MARDVFSLFLPIKLHPVIAREDDQRARASRETYRPTQTSRTFDAANKRSGSIRTIAAVCVTLV